MGPEVTDALSLPPVRGKLFVLEGPDGVGKTTQAARLRDWLAQRGLGVVSCRDPGGTPLGERLRDVLLERGTSEMGARAEALLYMAARAQLVEEVIRPALVRGDHVICDRFVLSNVVYQGASGGIDPDDIWKLGRVATQGLLPDLTMLIDLPVEEAIRRVGPGRDRIEDRPESYRTMVREGFLAQMMEYPAPIVLIDGGRDEGAVFSRLRAEVAGVLGIDPGP